MGVKLIYNRESVKVNKEIYTKLFGSEEISKTKCINIGAGNWEHPCWTNIDLPAQTEAFKKIQSPCIYHNIVEESDLPFENESLSLVYTSHVIEHLPTETVEKLFDSVFNKLESGGVFRVVTGPDADKDWDALNRKDKEWWYFYSEVFSEKDFTPNNAWLMHLCSPRSVHSETPCEQKYTDFEIAELLKEYAERPSELRDLLTQGIKFNISYPGDHISWWNEDKLLKFLKNAGFSKVKKSAYGQSCSVFMRDLSYFDLTYPQISLYVEAIK